MITHWDGALTMTQRDLFEALTVVRKRREQVVRHLDALDREEAELNITERVLQKLRMDEKNDMGSRGRGSQIR